MPKKERRILVITSCSAKKKGTTMRAIDLYDGDFFKKVKKFAKIHGFDLRIISAKYGLISPNDKIAPYDLEIKNSKDIEELQKKINPILEKTLIKYDKILIIMGENYKKIISPLMSEKFINFFDNRGLGGYNSLMAEILKMDKKKLYKMLFEQNNTEITVKTLEKNNIKFKSL